MMFYINVDNPHNIVDKRADNPHSGDRETEVLSGAVPDAGLPPAVCGTHRDRKVSHHQQLLTTATQGQVHHQQHQLLRPDLGQSDAGYHLLQA